MQAIDKRAMILGMAIVCSIGVSSAYAAGGGPVGGGNLDMPTRQLTPEDQAKQSYNYGIKRLKDAVEYEADAAKATDAKKIARANEKAQKAYEKAFKEFTNATDKLPSMYEAWNYVGYTQRHLGHYAAALAAYAKALQLKPNYPEALEYRGEAFLGLNAIDDAKQSYLALFRTAPPLAVQLMTAMHAWVEHHRKDAAGVDDHTVEGFATWINERETIAGQSAATSTADRW